MLIRLTFGFVLKKIVTLWSFKQGCTRDEGIGYLGNIIGIFSCEYISIAAGRRLITWVLMFIGSLLLANQIERVFFNYSYVFEIMIDRISLASTRKN